MSGKTGRERGLVREGADACRDFEEQDQFCPRCDNHFLLEASGPETEGEMAILQSDDPEALRQYGEVKLVDPRMRNR